MWTKGKGTKRKKLSREIFLLIVMDVAVAIGAYFFFRSWAGTIVYDYCEKNQIVLDEWQSFTLDGLIFDASLLGALLVFVTLFLVLVGNKLHYIKELTEGIHALRTHQMDHEIPLKGNNELTELAESINYLAETERQLKVVQRNLSHDIRTPLTAILSYAEYMQSKDGLTQEELDDFLELIKRKAQQMKMLTERLLDDGVELTEIEDGRLLMAQLADEWEEILEENFVCQVDFEDCPDFQGQFDLEELRRIFDNLSSNIEKYADETMPVWLKFTAEKGRLVIEQSNKKSKAPRAVESRKIGLTSVDNIAKHFGGSIEVEETSDDFAIKIILFQV